MLDQAFTPEEVLAVLGPGESGTAVLSHLCLAHRGCSCPVG